MRASSVILLPHAPSSVAIARRRLRTALRDAGADQDVIDDAGVVISELLSNALRHARPLPSGQVRLTWSYSDSTLKLAVTDGGSQTQPRKGPGTLSSLGGRGLGIVETLTRDWGVRHESGMTTVWATLKTPRGGDTASTPAARLPTSTFADLADLGDLDDPGGAGEPSNGMTAAWNGTPRPRRHPA